MKKIASYITSEVATRISASKNSIRTGTGKNIVADVSGNMAAIDTSTLPSGGNVSEYEITLSKGGKLLRKNRVPCSEKVYTETIGADKVEIVPVYRYENVQNVNNGITLGEFEEGLYNITFKKNGKARCDIYVNGAMVGNNIDQSGEGRKAIIRFRLYSISLSPNLQQIREMLDGLFKSCPLMRKHYSILTKVGNTNIRNINVYYQNTILYKVCLEKETVWTTVRWKTSSED